ncbi:MAG TPA: sugar ABC transporter permease [Chloroflexia bacterium]|nr:sugar ABC transporter permease [Chloroflexia bacterium]
MRIAPAAVGHPGGNDPPPGRLGRWLQRYGWSYAFVAPSMIVFSIFTFIPALASLLIAFQDVQLRGVSRWVGFDNFGEAFTSQGGIFGQALANTALYTVVTVTANVFIALGIAGLIQPLSRHAQTFFRAAYYLPAVTSAVIIGVVWRWIFNTQWGLFNFLLSLVHLEPVRWLADPDVALSSVILSTVLSAPATGIVLFNAAMNSVPRDLYEAADLEGAGPVRQWWHITLPLIKPVTLYVVVLYTIASFEVFDKIIVMVPTGVGNSTEVIVTQIYRSGFQQFRYGVAAAQAFILFLVIAGVAAIQFRFLRSDVEY